MAVATTRHADAPAGCSPSARTARLLCRITAVRDAALGPHHVERQHHRADARSLALVFSRRAFDGSAVVPSPAQMIVHDEDATHLDGSRLPSTHTPALSRGDRRPPRAPRRGRGRLVRREDDVRAPISVGGSRCGSRRRPRRGVVPRQRPQRRLKPPAAAATASVSEKCRAAMALGRVGVASQGGARRAPTDAYESRGIGAPPPTVAVDARSRVTRRRRREDLLVRPARTRSPPFAPGVALGAARVPSPTSEVFETSMVSSSTSVPRRIHHESSAGSAGGLTVWASMDLWSSAWMTSTRRWMSRTQAR